MAKFVIVSIMAMASGALASAGDEGFSAVVAGGSRLLMAAFAPFVVLRLIPVFKSGITSQLDGVTTQRDDIDDELDVFLVMGQGRRPRPADSTPRPPRRSSATPYERSMHPRRAPRCGSARRDR